jgi:DNA-binding MarR family transcriptional regulator
MGANHNTGQVRQNAKLEAVFNLLRSLQPDLNLSLAVTLLAVAREPGLSVNELAERVVAPQQTVSRYVAILQGRYELPGNESFARHPLLALEVSAQDPRRRAVFLTPHGTKRVTQILSARGEI